MLGIEFYGYTVGLENLDITVNYDKVSNFRYTVWDGDTKLFACGIDGVYYITHKTLWEFVELGYITKEEAFDKVGDYLYVKELIDNFKEGE